VNAQRCSLLVVDDEPYILPTLAALLAGDFEVSTADSADAAQEVFSRRPIDVVLTDQKMPRRTGIQLLEWVREHSPRTVRLLMTGYAELEDAVEAINRGHVYHYLLKPWRTEELMQILRNAAEKCLLERNRDQLLEELRELNRDLEARVAERTRELEEANHLLQQRTRELERLALTDPLTGLFNRRAMDELARFELKRHARYPSPLTLGFIDIDHFKQINTNYLLTGGDEVLRALARMLTGSLREVDSVGRVGGEEFLIIARETNEEGARKLAERVRSTVANTPIPYDRHQITITVSIGFAVAEEGVSADYEGMNKLAALALNEAKAAGRNRFVVHRLGAANPDGSVVAPGVSPTTPS
jgi:diguanylate cyclase (GGDEF)-like protein